MAKDSGALLRLKGRRCGKIVSLTSTLAKNAPSFKSSFNKKLSLVGKGITHIDCDIGWPFVEATVVYLSRNKLSSLEGIQQFADLRTLSIAENDLAIWASIEALGKLPILESVSLEGNPLAENLPNYRSHVISIIGPSLQLIDGVKVTAEERAMAHEVCHIEEIMTSIAVSNACLVHKLGKSLQMAAVHLQLLESIGCTLTECPSSFRQRAARLARVWNYSADDNENSIKNAIEREVVRCYGKLSRGSPSAKAPKEASKIAATWRESFLRVLNAQIDAIGEILQLIKASSSCTDPAAAALCNSKTGENSLGTSQPESEPWMDTCAELRQTIVELTYNSSDAAQTVAHMHQRLLMELAAADDDGSFTKSKKHDIEVDDWVIAANVTYEETAAVGEVQELQNQIMALEQALNEAQSRALSSEQHFEYLNAEVVMLRQKEAATQEAVVALQGWLAAANDRAAAAEDALLALKQEREDAREIKKSDEAASQAALRSLESQLEAARSEAATTARTDAAAIMALQDTVSSLSERNSQVDEQYGNLHYEYNELMRQNEELRSRLEGEQHQQSELQVALAGLHLQLNAQTAEMHAREARTVAERQELCSSTVEKWRAHTEKQKRLQLKEDRALAWRCHKVAAAGLKAWRCATTRSKAIYRLRGLANRSIGQSALRRWKAHATSCTLERALEAASTAAYRIRLMQHCTNFWRSSTALYRQIEPSDEVAVMAAAKLRHRQRKKVFDTWHCLARAEAVPRVAAALLATIHYESSLLREHFALWQCALHVARQNAVREKQGTAARHAMLLRSALCVWRREYRQTVHIRTFENEVSMRRKGILYSRAFDAWVEHCRAVADSKAEEHAEALARASIENARDSALQRAVQRAEAKTRTHTVRICREAFQRWQLGVGVAQQAGHARARAQQWWHQRRTSRYLNAWRVAVIMTGLESRSQTIKSLDEELQVQGCKYAAQEAQLNMLLNHLDSAKAEADELSRRLLQSFAEVEAAQRSAMAGREDAEIAEIGRLEVERKCAELLQSARAAEERAAEASIIERERRSRIEMQWAEAEAEWNRIAEAARAAEESAKSEILAAREDSLRATDESRAAHNRLQDLEIQLEAAMHDIEEAERRHRCAAAACQKLETALHASQSKHLWTERQLHAALQELDVLANSKDALALEGDCMRNEVRQLKREARWSRRDKIAAEQAAEAAIRQADVLASLEEERRHDAGLLLLN